MRWVLLFTIVVSVLLSSVAPLLHGQPSLPLTLVQGSWLTLLGWLVRKLF